MGITYFQTCYGVTFNLSSDFISIGRLFTMQFKFLSGHDILTPTTLDTYW